MTITTSCGIFFVNGDNRILVGHPTNSQYGVGVCTIPKGKQEPGETLEETAKREFFEESGILIDAFPDGTLEYLDQEVYVHKKKRIVAFYFKTNLEVNPYPVCNSFIEKDGKRFPEIDRFYWCKYIEAVKLVHYTQRAILERHKEKFKDEPQ
jgi:predicted NUDIX family NTP pyrophosphohydrolase